MNKNVSRKNQQTSENASQVKVDAPDTRFQNDQQTQTAMQSGSNDVVNESFIPKKTTNSGATLKQEVASEVITGKSGSGISGVGSPSSYGLREMSFSGDASTILGNASGTPTLSKDIQGKSRLDKKLSDANKDINYNASEQVHVEYKMIPALADDDGTVGFNGNPKNEAVRAQKNTGLTPAEELYDRSLDFVTADYAVFTSGQRVEQLGVQNATYPTLTDFIDEDGVVKANGASFTEGKQPLSGNFMPDFLTVTVAKKNGKPFVKKFLVSEHDISANEETAAVVNASSSNAQIDRNMSELVRQTMDAKAGAPTQAGFNPLGRSVKQPTQTLTLLRDIESSMGATVFTAYKFAQKARGHYLNRTAKDGQNLLDPAIDALYGGLTSAQNMAELVDLLGASDDKSPMIYPEGIKHGSAAIMLSIFDSASKYKTKADLVNQPRGLKMHLQTADNNMDPFRCKREFVSAINSVDAYSTIDHGYDPMAPIFISDNFKLVYPYSLSRMLEYHRDEPGKKVFDSEVFTYHYAAGAGVNTYYVRVGEPVLNGVSYFIEMHIAEIANALGVKKDGDEEVWHIPMTHSTTHFSLWDLLICASTPYIIYERTNSLKDILDYEVNFEYPFNDFVAISAANPMNAVNYGNPSALEPLVVKQMMPSSAIRWKYPEMLYPLGAEAYLLPFYFNERDVEWGSDEYKATAEITIQACENFSTPMIRSGVKLAGLDSFYDMDVKSQLLNMDVMTRVPGLPSGEYCKGGIYKYSQGSDGIPFVFASSDVFNEATTVNYMATPRQLGWFFVLPGGIASVKRTEDGAQFCPFHDFAENMFDAGPSYKAVMYKGGYAPSEAPTAILGNASVNVSRAQAFVQNWHVRHASRYGSNLENFDLMLSPLDGFSTSDPVGSDVVITAVDGKTSFRPFTVGRYSALQDNRADVLGVSADSFPRLFSIMRVYWAAMQKLPFIINPFAAYAEDSNASEGYIDPFDLAYLFGLSGFVAANYYEELYNRANQVMNQGYGYTRDPLIASSPVFIDAIKYTEIG